MAERRERLRVEKVTKGEWYNYAEARCGIEMEVVERNEKETMKAMSCGL